MKQKTDSPHRAAWKSITAQPRRAAGLVLVLIVIAVVALSLRGCGGDNATDDTPLFTVARGPLTISITETGSVENREKVVVKNKVEGQQTVIWLVEEGASVKTGDLLVELDTSDLETKRVDREINLQNSEASLIQARESLAVARNQAEADVDAAQLALKFAKMDLEKYKLGEYPQQLQMAEADITLAGEEVERAADTVEWSKRLAEEGFITRSELQGDELSVKRARINLELVQSELELLKTYTHTKKLEQLESDERQAEMALDRDRRKAKASVVKAEADLRAKQSQYDRQKEELEKLVEQIGYCRITAPVDGMVVYATSGGHHWRRGEPLDVGAAVRQRQELIHLPTTSDMIAKLSVPETVRTKVKPGMPALVRIDALDNHAISGTLSKIGVLPDATRAWLNPDLKSYRCEVQLAKSPPNLRPGMSCQAEIVLEEYADAIYVPVQCVVRVNGRHVAMVMTRHGPEEREVTIGMDNGRMVHVLDGLEPGEDVLLAPPLEASKESGRPEPEPAPDPVVPKETGQSEDGGSRKRRPANATPGERTGKARGKSTEG